MDMMCPFCIKCHVDVHFDSSILSIKIDARKKSFSLRLPLKHMVDLIIVGLAIKNFWLSNLWWLNYLVANILKVPKYF
jgi:hypothetical protein